MQFRPGGHPPSFNDPDHIIFTHIRHVEVVRPCSLGEREKAIQFRTEIAYPSQHLLVDEDFLKKVFDDLQLPICVGSAAERSSWRGGEEYTITDDGSVEVSDMCVQISNV